MCTDIRLFTGEDLLTHAAALALAGSAVAGFAAAWTTRTHSEATK